MEHDELHGKGDFSTLVSIFTVECKVPVVRDTQGRAKGKDGSKRVEDQ